MQNRVQNFDFCTEFSTFCRIYYVTQVFPSLRFFVPFYRKLRFHGCRIPINFRCPPPHFTPLFRPSNDLQKKAGFVTKRTKPECVLFKCTVVFFRFVCPFFHCRNILAEVEKRSRFSAGFRDAFPWGYGPTVKPSEATGRVAYAFSERSARTPARYS